MHPPRRGMTWPEALAAAGQHGHRVVLLDPPPGFYRQARCLQCGGLILAISGTDAFGEITRQLCPQRASL